MNSMKTLAESWWHISTIKKALNCVSAPITSNPLWFVFVYVWGSICNLLVVWNGSRLIGFLQLFVDVYILTVFVTCFPKRTRRIVKLLLCLLLCPISIVDLFCYYKFGSPITPTLLHVFLQTNRNEASEALSSYIAIDATTYPVVVLFILIVVFSSIAFSRKARAWVNNIVSRTKTTLSLSVFVSLFVALCCTAKNEVYLFHRLVLMKDEKSTYESMQYSPTVRFYTPIHRLVNALIEYHQENSVIESLHATVENTFVEDCSFTSPNIVLVLGESYSRQHSQLYGYDKPTTPFQAQYAKDSNFVVFDNVISAWNLTYEVFKNMLSTHCACDEGEWHQYPLFTTLFKKAGYNVAFLSNQFVVNSDTYSDFQENILLNDSKMSEAQFDVRNAKRFRYDEELLDECVEVEVSFGRGNLIIYHLMGQHVDFKERYPKEWALFEPCMYPGLSEETAAIVAQYDNATLYNDYVLSRIIEKYKNTETIIIHTSDHGERSGLNGDGYGRRFSFCQEDIEGQYEIPFWIFMTTEYEKKHVHIKQKIVNATQRPISTDNIAHLMLSLAGIKTKYYNPLYDPLSVDFDSLQPRLIWDTFDYDKRMELKK